jgi:hypothetical protein
MRPDRASGLGAVGNMSRLDRHAEDVIEFE